MSPRRDRQKTRRLDRKRHASDFERQSCELKRDIVQLRQDNERRDDVGERHAAEAVSDRHSCENRLHGGGAGEEGRHHRLPPGDLKYEAMELKRQRRSEGGSQWKRPLSPTEPLPAEHVRLLGYQKYVFFLGGGVNGASNPEDNLIVNV